MTDNTTPLPPTDTFRPFAVVDRLCKSCGHIQPARQGMKCESCSEEWQWSVPVSTAPQSSSADKQKLADRVAAALRLREWDRAEIEQVRSMLSTPPSATAPKLRFNLTPKQLAQLCAFSFEGVEPAFTEDASEVTLGWLPEHEDGPGWYVWLAEYPEEGSLPLVTHLLSQAQVDKLVAMPGDIDVIGPIDERADT